MPPKIETPRGKIFVTKAGRSILRWNTSFKPKWFARYSASQRFIDSEVLRRSQPYTPLLTGVMIKSGTLGTEIGSGFVEWIAPYSKSQYYSKRKPGSETGPLRGPQWFERMKAAHGAKIIAKAKLLAGGGVS